MIKKSSSNFPALITCTASLAHNGLLGSVEEMMMKDVDLNSVPAEHLISVVSSVTGEITIWNVSGLFRDLVTILDSVKSVETLEIMYQSLGSEETWAMVRAMESRVELLTLDDMDMDIKVLMEYSGQGICRSVCCFGDAAPRYREQLRTWAISRHWEVTDDYMFRVARM